MASSSPANVRNPHPSHWALFDGEQTEIRAEVDFGHVLRSAHLQPIEARSLPDSSDRQASILQRLLDYRDYLVDLSCRGAEEIEIPGQSVDVSPSDESGTTGERELVCLGQVPDDGRDLKLKLRQHASSMCRLRKNQSAQA